LDVESGVIDPLRGELTQIRLPFVLVARDGEVLLKRTQGLFEFCVVHKAIRRCFEVVRTEMMVI
jgi:hypothetical protein